MAEKRTKKTAAVLGKSEKNLCKALADKLQELYDKGEISSGCELGDLMYALELLAADGK